MEWLKSCLAAGRWLVTLGVVLMGLSGCGLGETEGAAKETVVAIEGLYPRFAPDQGRYVSRCGRGESPVRVRAGKGVKVAVSSAPARRGAFQIDPAAAAGEDFEFAVIDGPHRRSYEVRCLPADFPKWRFQGFRDMEPGFFTVGFRASRKERPWVIVFDEEGTPRWWYSPDTRVLWAQVLAEGNLQWARSFGDGYGLDPRMAHEIRSPSGHLLRLVRTQGSITDGHEFRELGNGNVLVDSYHPETADLRRFGGPRRAAIVSAEVQELDPLGRVLWRWNSRGQIGLRETGRWWRNVLSNPRRRLHGRPTYDPVHINSIEPRGRDEVVISARHTDAVYGISRSSGEIAWKLGGTETGKSLRVIDDPAHWPFGGQHDVRIDSKGRLSVHDNSKDRPRPPRVVFYRLDLDDGEARYLGQLNDPEVKTSHCCGSARPFGDGGWLVSWGDNRVVTAFDAQGRPSFRLRLPASTFRAVPAPPGAVTIARLDRGLEAMEHKAQGPQSDSPAPSPLGSK